MKIGFLFNHDAMHQIPHTMPVAVALAARGIEVEILTSSEAQQEVAKSFLSPGGNIQFTMLRIGPIARGADLLLRHLLPFRRIAILSQNRAVFGTFDAIVVPETTSTLLKTRFGLKNLKLIYLPHGAGDGAAGFQQVTRNFDFVLLSGAKIRDRMLALGLIRKDAYAIVGYPKFDAFAGAPAQRFFDNDRPTVVYNPHFNPRLSSWYEMGEQVLAYFAADDRFNLIFAPHVMLFKRRVHITTIHRRARFRRNIAAKYFNQKNITIDTGSGRSIDMSYLRGADIYLGDVSSQIYEWIQTPRPAIFLNTHQPRWKNHPDYRQWVLGEVIDSIAQLPAALDRAMAEPLAFAERQNAAAAETFDKAVTSASERAADAIIKFMTPAAAA
jgi:hypothetical protein